MLNKKQIEKLIKEKKLVEGYMDLEKQLTSNGIDLTVTEVSKFLKAGFLDFSNKERVIPETKIITAKKKKAKDKYGWWNLAQGTYKVKTNEIINLSNELTALAFSRTSILRMGCFTAHGVWDAGFSGRGEFTLSVENKKGLNLKENARIVQLVFFAIKETEGYNGIHQNLL